MMSNQNLLIMRFLLALVLSFAYTVGKSESVTPLRFHKDGNFKILQLTDLHWIAAPDWEPKNDSTLSLIQTLIQKENPDLIVFTGDIVVSSNAKEGWKKMLKPIVSQNIPFVINFGNHDVETDISKRDLLQFLNQYPNHLTYSDGVNIEGEGNCGIPVHGSKDESKKWMLYFFDSQSYTKDTKFGVYDWIRPAQVAWYRQKRDSICRELGNYIPSLAFFHIPTFEYKDVKEDKKTIGNKLEDISCPSLNSGLIASFLEKNDVLGVFVGHDHNNDFIGTYRDEIALAYGRKTGYPAAYKELLERGARVIQIYEQENRFTSYIRTLDQKSTSFSFEKKIKGDSFAKLNGSFVQDWLVRDWSDEQWQEEFGRLKEAGMKYLVLAPTLSVDKHGKSTSIYPSHLMGTSNFGRVDVVDNCLRNAEKAGFLVFLGLNFHEGWWDDRKSESWLIQQMKEGNKVADELYTSYKSKYPTAFYGWYWVWEVANVPEFFTEKGESLLVKALNTNLHFLSGLDANMPVMLAPYMNSKLGSAKQYAEMWATVFARTDFRAGDIFSPQDCVGAGGLGLEQVSEWFGALKEAVDTKPELRFWSDAETFDQAYWTSANIGRLKQQMDAVKPFVSGIISFSYSHYYTAQNKDKFFHDAYLTYSRLGHLVFQSNMEQISDAKFKPSKGGNRMSWSDVKSDRAGYFIYKNGAKVADIQNKKTGSKNRYFDEKGTDKDLYKVSWYNAVGQVSDPVSFEK